MINLCRLVHNALIHLGTIIIVIKVSDFTSFIGRIFFGERRNACELIEI